LGLAALHRSGLAASSPTASDPGFSVDAAARTRLVLLHLQGGLDGLNCVIPYFDRDYYRLRPSFSIPPPTRSAGSSIDLDGRHALHPSLASLANLFHSGRMLVFHAVGLPGCKGSHYSAKRSLEAGFQALDQEYASTARHRLAVETVSLTGWDDHLAADCARFGDRLTGLAAAINSLRENSTEDTVILAFTEFGRSVGRNSLGGTDHGRGSIVFLVGDRVAGGRVVCDWPGLPAPDSISSDAGIEATTNLLDVYRMVLRGLPDTSGREGASPHPGLCLFHPAWNGES